ncbi:MAG TPA: hypothetical protein PLD27_06170 [bacterium]|nr:hypothetical protein [bacterium]HOL46855.1 hypothetical protein [bacterium]
MKNFWFIFLFLFILIAQSLFAENENLLNIKGLIEIDYYLAKVNDGTTNKKESDFLLSTA